MVQAKRVGHKGQCLYLGRWVDKSLFRTFVYSETEKKLANSYAEYEQLIASGLWFDTPEDVKPKPKPNVEVLKPNADDAKPNVKLVKPKEAPKVREPTNGANS